MGHSHLSVHHNGVVSSLSAARDVYDLDQHDQLFRCVWHLYLFIKEQLNGEQLNGKNRAHISRYFSHFYDASWIYMAVQKFSVLGIILIIIVGLVGIVGAAGASLRTTSFKRLIQIRVTRLI